MARERGERIERSGSERAAETSAAPAPPSLSIAEIRQLVAMINSSDIEEIAIDRAADGLKLVLRRLPAGPLAAFGLEGEDDLDAGDVAGEAGRATAAENSYEVSAPLVGVFRANARPGGKPLVPGDVVREGQVIAAIEALNVWNEVEATEAGRVREVIAADGTPVEYGQPLLIIERQRA
jgi:acetyl-CoA carboxylase biotin carboxyl carrier protein